MLQDINRVSKPFLQVQVHFLKEGFQKYRVCWMPFVMNGLDVCYLPGEKKNVSGNILHS